MKNQAVEAALREGYSAKDLMHMRWVITRKADGALKARLVVLGYVHRSTVGAHQDRFAHRKPKRAPSLLVDGRQSRHDGG